MHPTFHPIFQIFDVGRNVGCVWGLRKLKTKNKKTKKRKEKEEKNLVGRYWMKFVLDQILRQTFFGSSNQIFMLDEFAYSFIQHLDFHRCVEWKTYMAECISNGFINIWKSIICGMPQKIKTREGHKQGKREEVKIAVRKKGIQMVEKIGTTMRFPCLLTCST